VPGLDLQPTGNGGSGALQGLTCLRNHIDPGQRHDLGTDANPVPASASAPPLKPPLMTCGNPAPADQGSP